MSKDDICIESSGYLVECDGVCINLNTICVAIQTHLFQRGAATVYRRYAYLEAVFQCCLDGQSHHTSIGPTRDERMNFTITGASIYFTAEKGLASRENSTSFNQTQKRPHPVIGGTTVFCFTQSAGPIERET